jgi:prepilin-type N-terminal cleavage/methylation domain-containing protein
MIRHPIQQIRSGFTLIELILVMAIIALLATLTLPGLIDSKRQANEVRVTKYMANLGVAQEMFHQRYSIYAGESTYDGMGTAGMAAGGDEELINAGVASGPFNGLAGNDEVIFGYHFFVKAGGSREPQAPEPANFDPVDSYQYIQYINRDHTDPGQPPQISWWFAWCHSVTSDIGKRCFYTDFRGVINYTPGNFGGIGEFVGPEDRVSK